MLQQPNKHTIPVPQVELVLNVKERKSGGLSAGGGISAQGHAQGALPGFIGSASYAQRNLFGLNQKLSATVELGQARRSTHPTLFRRCQLFFAVVEVGQARLLHACLRQCPQLASMLRSRHNISR